jgi:hypothetical protein
MYLCGEIYLWIIYLIQLFIFYQKIKKKSVKNTID